MHRDALVLMKCTSIFIWLEKVFVSISKLQGTNDYYNNKQTKKNIMCYNLCIFQKVPWARSSASAVKSGAWSMSAVSTINMSFSLRRSWGRRPSYN